jgi:hypothetical protein
VRPGFAGAFSFYRLAFPPLKALPFPVGPPQKADPTTAGKSQDQVKVRTARARLRDALKRAPLQRLVAAVFRNEDKKQIPPDLKELNMKNKKIDAVRVWKEMEDLVVPRLHLSVIDRVVYSHLLRHSRLEGRQQLRFSILWLARGACLSTASARKAVRSLVAKGALRLAERSKAGHVVTVCLPEEIRSVRSDKIAESATERVPSVGDFENADFLETRALREAIHAREGGLCFYCLCRMRPMVRCIDHVVARVRGGRNGYRASRGLSALAVARGAFERRGTQRAAQCAGEARRRKASACAPQPEIETRK